MVPEEIMHKLGGSEGGTRVDHGEICGSDGEFGKRSANIVPIKVVSLVKGVQIVFS